MKINKIILGILAILLLSSFAVADLTTNNLVYYSFDDADLSGIDPLDLSINGNDGTNNGADTGVPSSISKQAFRFVSANTDDLIAGTLSGVKAVSFWADFNTTTNSEYLYGHGKDGDYNNGYFGIMRGSTTNYAVSYQFYAGGSWQREDTGIYSGLHHFVLTLDTTGDDAYFYIDGVLDATINDLPDGLGSSLESRISLNNPSGSLYNFDGIMDEFALFGAHLTASDVLELYNSGDGNNFYGTEASPFEISAQTYGSYQLEDFNATIGASSFQTTNGTIISSILDNSTSLYNITIETQYFNLSYLNYNVSVPIVFDYSVLEVDVKNIRNNASIDNFNLTLNDFSRTLESNNSKVVLYLNETQNNLLNVTATSPTIATTNQLLYFTGTNVSTSTIYVYQANSIDINIYDVASGELMNVSVNVQLNLDGNLTSNDTSDGTLFVYNLTAGNYSLTFTATDYTTVSYDATVTNFSTQTLNAYMTPTATGQSTIFAFKNIENEAIVEGVTLSVERIISDVWTLVNVLSSDVSGRAQFDYETGVKYRFTASKNGFETREFTLNPVIFTSYNIWLTQEIEETQEQDFSGVNILAYPGTYYNGQNNTVELIFASPDGRLQSYGFTATYKTTSITKSGSNLYGGSLTDLLLIENATLGDQVNLYYYYRLSNGSLKEFNSPYTIADTATPATQWNNKDEHYGLGLAERVLIVIGIVILVSGTAFMFGGAVAGGIVAMLIFGYFLFIGFVSGWIVIPSMIAIFIFTAWGATK